MFCNDLSIPNFVLQRKCLHEDNFTADDFKLKQIDDAGDLYELSLPELFWDNRFSRFVGVFKKKSFAS